MLFKRLQSHRTKQLNWRWTLKHLITSNLHWQPLARNQPVISRLHWLPVCQIWEFNRGTLVYRTLQCQLPSYLSQELSTHHHQRLTPAVFKGQQCLICTLLSQQFESRRLSCQPSIRKVYQRHFCHQKQSFGILTTVENATQLFWGDQCICDNFITFVLQVIQISKEMRDSSLTLTALSKIAIIVFRRK